MTKPSTSRRRALSVGELMLALFGLTVLAFGVGAGIGWIGLGWTLVPVVTVLIAFAFVLALIRGRTMRRSRPPAAPPAAPPVTPPATPAVPQVRPPSVGARPQVSYYLGAAGGAALALTLGGLLVLALPGDTTAVVLLVIGVVTWTTVVLLSFLMNLHH